MEIIIVKLEMISELLDISMNRKVVQEVDRLLKKQPNFTCAKVLELLKIFVLTWKQISAGLMCFFLFAGFESISSASNGEN